MFNPRNGGRMNATTSPQQRAASRARASNGSSAMIAIRDVSFGVDYGSIVSSSLASGRGDPLHAGQENLTADQDSGASAGQSKDRPRGRLSLWPSILEEDHDGASAATIVTGGEVKSTIERGETQEIDGGCWRLLQEWFEWLTEPAEGLEMPCAPEVEDVSSRQSLSSSFSFPWRSPPTPASTPAAPSSTALHTSSLRKSFTRILFQDCGLLACVSDNDAEELTAFRLSAAGSRFPHELTADRPADVAPALPISCRVNADSAKNTNAAVNHSDDAPRIAVPTIVVRCHPVPRVGGSGAKRAGGAEAATTVRERSESDRDSAARRRKKTAVVGRGRRPLVSLRRCRKLISKDTSSSNGNLDDTMSSADFETAATVERGEMLDSSRPSIGEDNRSSATTVAALLFTLKELSRARPQRHASSQRASYVSTTRTDTPGILRCGDRQRRRQGEARVVWFGACCCAVWKGVLRTAGMVRSRGYHEPYLLMTCSTFGIVSRAGMGCTGALWIRLFSHPPNNLDRYEMTSRFHRQSRVPERGAPGIFSKH